MRLFKQIERSINRIKQQYLLHTLMQKYHQDEVIQRFKKMPSSNEGREIGSTSPIWVCWWQGEEQMPEVVRLCYRSILRHAGHHPVVLLTEENQAQYLRLPDLVWRKFREGVISRTHLSDIARVYLLKEHGGIWMDATILLTKDIDLIVDIHSAYWSYRHVTPYNNVSKGLWTGYFQASGSGHLIPSYLYESFIYWWEHNNRLFTYLLIDYCFRLGYDHLPDMRHCIDALPVRPIGMLRKILDSAYEANRWEQVIGEAPFHKLSYKKYTTKCTKQGEPTHYAHLLELDKELETPKIDD